MSGVINQPYSTLQSISWSLIEGSTFLLLSTVILLLVVARDPNVRSALLATALGALPRALTTASVLIIAALAAVRLGHSLHVGAVLDFVLDFLDFMILALLLAAPHLFAGAILLPLVRFFSRGFAAVPIIGGLASVPVVLLAVFQRSLIPNFS